MEAVPERSSGGSLRFPARFLSFVFHPLFIPTYVACWIAARFPNEFAGMDPVTLKLRLFSTFWTTAFFPALVVFLLWRLKLTSNIYLRTQKERIVPYIASMIFYWWMWYQSLHFTDQPLVLRSFYFGIFVCTVPALIINNFMKISMHGMGIGAAVTICIITAFTYRVYLGLDISLVVLVGGALATARMLLKEHSPQDVYLGIFLGALCQLLAAGIFL